MYNHQEYIERNKQKSTPEFKVGDWVNTSKIKPHLIAQIDNTTRTITDEDGGSSFTINVIEYTMSNGAIFTDGLAPWQPKHGDWIWVWDYIDVAPDLCKFISSNNNNYLAANNGTSWTYKYAQPFIGTLPEQLKDK